MAIASSGDVIADAEQRYNFMAIVGQGGLSLDDTLSIRWQRDKFHHCLCPISRDEGIAGILQVSTDTEDGVTVSRFLYDRVGNLLHSFGVTLSVEEATAPEVEETICENFSIAARLGLTVPSDDDEERFWRHLLSPLAWEGEDDQ